jgi:hypothetical protein|nr:MAG TPA: hypothetical protein [Caudoviricetes sp.]
MKKLLISGETVNYILPHKTQNIAQSLAINIPEFKTFPKSWLSFQKQRDSKLWRENLKTIVEEYAKENGQKIYVKFSNLQSGGAYSIEAIFFVPDSLPLNWETQAELLKALKNKKEKRKALLSRYEKQFSAKKYHDAKHTAKFNLAIAGLESLIFANLA